jgi:hypothetical protein
MTSNSETGIRMAEKVSVPERSDLQVQALVVKHLWNQHHYSRTSFDDLDFKINLETLLEMIAEGRS